MSAPAVPFVDLFAVTQSVFQGNPLPVGPKTALNIERPATINGIHQNSKGDWIIATHIDQSLFGPRTEKIEDVAALHSAVTEGSFSLPELVRMHRATIASLRSLQTTGVGPFNS